MSDDWFGLIEPECWEELTREPGMKELSLEYQSAKPFPHIVIDGLFTPSLLAKAVDHFPMPDSSWWHYDNPLERKFAKDDLSDAHPSLRVLVQLMMEKRFTDFLERLTGIKGLISDQRLTGGGFHQITRGGKLDIHADHNFHSVTKLDRRLNVLLYLNEGWKSAWGGQLELWDKGMTKCVNAIDPIFNRMVIFSTTDWAYHGHPEVLQCPEGVTRKSIALYFFSNGRPEEERSAPHSTLYKRRPQDPDSKELADMRAMRAVGRLS